MSALLEIEWDVDAVPEAEEELNRVAAACVRAEGICLPVYAQLRVTDDAEIQRINREYRNVDRATDVLSFPAVGCTPEKTLGQCERRLLRERDESGACFLGDIVLSLPRAREQAREYGHSLQREMAYLTAHALFHLMGYDHMNQQDKERMRAMEEQALSEAGFSRVTDAELMALAEGARAYSYAPYSHYRVGAALLCRDGRVFTGCNIENASYGATNCAERTALFKAVSEGAQAFTVIAIAAEKAAPWPCGLCRQALNEFAPDLRILVAWDGKQEEATLRSLLPHGFGPQSGTREFLGRE